MLPFDRLKQTLSNSLLDDLWFCSTLEGMAVPGLPAGWWPREGRRLSLPVSLCFLGDSSNDCVFFMDSCPSRECCCAGYHQWVPVPGSKTPHFLPLSPQHTQARGPPQLLVSGLSPWSLPCLSTIPSLCNPTLGLKDSFCVLVVFHKFLEVAFSCNSLSF